MANELDAYKTEQTKLLEAQRAREQERAAINHRKLLKYLEQTSAGQSVGMTESAKIAAANNYSRDVAAADAAYNQGMGELNHYLRTEQERLDDKAKAEQDEIYGEVMTKIESGEFNTTTELSSYLNDKTIDTDGDGVPESSFLDLMSPTQRATVQGKLSYYKKKPEQIAAEIAHQQAETAQKWATMSVEDAKKQFNETHVGGTAYTASGINSGRSYGNNFIIEDGDGKKYGVQLAQKIVETDTYNTGTGQQIGMIQHFNQLGLSEGEVFTVNGHAYIKLGTDYYEVTTRTGKGKTAPTELIDALSGAGTQSATVGGQQQTGQTTPYIIAENADMIVYSDGTKVRKTRY